MTISQKDSVDWRSAMKNPTPHPRGAARAGQVSNSNTTSKAPIVKWLKSPLRKTEHMKKYEQQPQIINHALGDEDRHTLW